MTAVVHRIGLLELESREPQLVPIWGTSGVIPALVLFCGNVFDKGHLETLVAEVGRPGPPVIVRPGRAIADEFGFETWGPEGRRRFAGTWSMLEEAAESGGRELWLWARRGEAISDVPSALGFLRGSERRRLLLDPVGMLTSEMIPRAREHLERSREAFAEHPQVSGVVVTDITRTGEDVPEGVLGAELLEWMVAPFVGRTVLVRLTAT